MILVRIVRNMELSMRQQLPTRLNQMEWLNEKNQTLTDLVNAMLDSSGLFKSWWGEAISTACFTLNRVPSANDEITPFEGWNGRKPSLGILRAWGCLAQVNVSECKE
jgi:hypothetical protein